MPNTFTQLVPLTPLPDPPDRRMSDQARFDQAAHASLKAQQAMVEEFNGGLIRDINAVLPSVQAVCDNLPLVQSAPENAATALAARLGAEAARDKAAAWADKPSGVQVEAGRYSALHWSEVARAAAGETTNQRVQRSWTTAADIADGGALDLPVGMTYTPGMNTLSLSFMGLDLYPGLQYEEMGDKGVPSSRVKLLFAAPKGVEFRAYVIAGPAGEADTPTPGMAQKIETRAWTLTDDVMAEGLVQLPSPLRYRPGYAELRLSAMGLQLFVDQQFSEFGDGTASSDMFRLKFPLKAGAELYAVVMTNFYTKE